MYRNCAAKDCDSSYNPSEKRRYRFPRDEVRCKLWVERSRNRDLLTASAEKLYATRRLCGKHFAPHAFQNALQHRLVHDAVPSIFEFNGKESENDKEPLEWRPTEKQYVVKKRSPPPSPALIRSLLQLSTTDPLWHKENPLSKPLHKPRHLLSEAPENISTEVTSRYPDTLQCKTPNILGRKAIDPLKTTPHTSRQVQLPTVAPEDISTEVASSYPEQEHTSDFMDLEPNIWEKHMELFEQSKGKEFLIVGEVCMLTEKDPDQMCGSVKCNDDLYSNMRTENLVRCWSRCKKWFHLRCTDLTLEEYNVLSSKESLRWLCEECCKADIF